MEKICPKCKKKKNTDKFSKNKNRKDGLDCYCKKCKNERSKKWYQENRETINKEKRKASSKKWHQKHKKERKEYDKKYYQEHKKERKEYDKKRYHANKEEIKENNRKWYYNNTEKIKVSGKKWRQEHKKERNEQRRNRRKNDLNFRILCSLRARLGIALRNQNAKKSDCSIELIGCSVGFLINHLESQFKNGMAWGNYGNKDNQWCIDHIKPCAAFDLTKESEQRKCFNYKNLQPLWGKDNWSKNSQHNGKLIRKSREKF